MDSNNLIEKMGNLTIAEARTCIFGPNLYLTPGTLAWGKQMESITKNMKYQLSENAKTKKKCP